MLPVFASDSVLLFTVFVLFVAASALFFFPKRKPWLSYIRGKVLLTSNEIEFFCRLERALPAFAIFPQVSFGALIDDDRSLPPQSRWNVRAQFDRKIADFVVCDRRTFRVIAIIELDDRTHQASADRQRDAVTRAAGYQTFRYHSKRKPTEAELCALFQHAQAWNIRE